MQQYQVRASGKSGVDTQVRLLSGGNQQKLIIARELTDSAKLIIASQPTRGLDIGATEFVRQQLINQRNAGKAVMLISVFVPPSLPEIVIFFARGNSLPLYLSYLY